MTVNLENEVVSTSYDSVNQLCIYVIERGRQRWTVSIPEKDLNTHGINKAARRIHLGQVLSQAMMGPPDEPPKVPSVVVKMVGEAAT